MTVRRAAILGVLVVAVVGVAMLLTRPWEVAPIAPTHEPSVEQPGPAPRIESTERNERQVVPTVTLESRPAELAFTSALDDGDDAPGPVPVRDGLVIVVREEGGGPCVRMPIDVYWRKGFGLYGHDRGPTDAYGRFPTTVRSADQIEGVEVEHPEFGAFRSSADFLVSAVDPREVHLVVPELVPLRVEVQDLDRRAVPGATIDVAVSPGVVEPRVFRLTREHVEGMADDDGVAEFRVPTGICRVDATRDGFESLTMRAVELSRAGGTIVALLLDKARRREVTVTVERPPGIDRVREVSAFSMPIPAARADELGIESDGRQRSFHVERRGHTFTTRVDPLPWRLVVHADGCEAGVVDCDGHETAVHVTLRRAAPPKPGARIEVTVVDPFDAPVVGAEVRVHESPDLVYGASHRTDRNGRFTFELEPGRRVVVSATGRSRSTDWARALAGPFELGAEAIDVRLALRQPLTIRGRVVDRDGSPIAARVELRRPSGILAELAGDVPEILPSAPTSDWLGTGPDGTFAFDDLFPGDHEVWAFPEAGAWPGRVRAVPGQDVTVVAGDGIEHLARVMVDVRDVATGEPVAAQISPLGYTDPSGRIFAVCQPGRLELQVYARDFVVTRWGPTELEPGLVPIELRIERSAPVFVRVLDASGDPISRAETSVIDPDLGEPRDLVDPNGNWTGTVQWTTAGGNAEFRGLPSGPLRLRVEHSGEFRLFDVPADAGRDEVFEVRFGN